MMQKRERCSQKVMEAFAEELQRKGYAEHTIEKYRRDICTFQKFLGGDVRIEKSRIQRYKDWLTAHYASGSVNSMIAALNRFLEFLGMEEWKLKYIQIQTQYLDRQEKYLTRGEYQRLLQTARAKGREMLALMMETMALTGVRVSELDAFRAEVLGNRYLEVCNKGKYRVVLLPKKLRRKLKDYCTREGIRAGRIFRTRSGGEKNRSNIWREMKALAEEAGVAPEKVFPHNLRHFFAVQFHQLTHDLVQLADLLGHSGLETTRIYTREGINTCIRELNRLYKRIEKGKGKRHGTT